jgi:hypothetical protein
MTGDGLATEEGGHDDMLGTGGENDTWEVYDTRTDFSLANG